MYGCAKLSSKSSGDYGTVFRGRHTSFTRRGTVKERRPSQIPPCRVADGWYRTHGAVIKLSATYQGCFQRPSQATALACPWPVPCMATEESSSVYTRSKKRQTGRRSWLCDPSANHSCINILDATSITLFMGCSCQFFG